MVSDMPGDGECGSVALSWRDLTLKVEKRGVVRHLLDHVSGFAEPRTLLAIMGSSGCGKTTLLNALSGRLGSLQLEKGSEILANGMRQQLSYGHLAYVTQDNSLITTLTVFETLLYSAHLQLPSTMSIFEKHRRVHQSIEEMGLEHCVDTRVGGWHVRGLSGGEKRRLNIAIETLRQPSLFFLDEPTSGLDSAGAFHVIKRLRTLAKGGRTVLVSIHQPSSEAFALFDYLCLLADGKTVYFGETNKALKFYEDAGFPCPSFRNPSDHFLWVINSSFEKINHGDIEEEGSSSKATSGSENVKALVKAYAESDILNNILARLHTSKKHCEKLKSHSERADFILKTYFLTLRSFKNMRRDLSYYWFRLMTYVVLAIVVGTIYYKVGTSYNAIQARAGMLMFVSSFLSFLGVLSFPCFIEDMKIFTRERLNGHYGVASFVVANSLSSFPFLVLTAVIPGSMVYVLGGLHPGLDRFFYFCMTLLACLSAVEGLLMAIASIVPDFLSGMMAGSAFLGMYLLTGGFFRLLGDLPKPLWRYPFSYISLNTWVNRAFYNNDFIGLEFENSVPGFPPIDGKVVVQMYQMDVDYNKWWLTFVLACMAIFYRLMFFFSMKLREKLPTIINNWRNGKVSQMIENASSRRLVVPHDVQENVEL